MLYDEDDNDNYINELLAQHVHEEWEKEMKSQYLMGTPQETFLKNIYHFGLLKALHRYFESKCVKYVAEEWILHKKVRNNPHNFVFYRPSLWRFALCNTMESYLRKKVYPKSK